MRSYDFGYGKPLSCAWWAIEYDGVLYRILELYGCTDSPNEGIRWTPDQQFQENARIEREMCIRDSACGTFSPNDGTARCGKGQKHGLDHGADHDCGGHIDQDLSLLHI